MEDFGDIENIEASFDFSAFKEKPEILASFLFVNVQENRSYNFELDNFGDVYIMHIRYIDSKQYFIGKGNRKFEFNKDSKLRVAQAVMDDNPDDTIFAEQLVWDKLQDEDEYEMDACNASGSK